MKSLAKKLGFGKMVRKFHDGEEGMETLQVVVIVAIAALVVLMLNKFIGTADGGDEGTIAGWTAAKIEEITGLEF